uniref:hypothetical protein n=1 Tax=Rhizobium loti TaxID=381 RepID=UPI001AEBD623
MVMMLNRYPLPPYEAPLCPARHLPLKGVFGPETSRTGVRRHREQFPMLSADCVEVDGLDFLVAEVDVEDTVLSGRSESDSPAGEGVADFECASEQRG